ncbi:cation diffusion facilitator family transporter [Adlercreutzia sp. R25]|uniref:cation diffusion facilitator family transporter n=1 Tax=Adlercreutzia shanghongiae TaxID=3111773 RepID=UPI002DB7A04E|nr:cation diffusion facilitator family transporter [Adlercreutzia sp. R25]MEC4272799.1 cation diffusion facilitator family transporter [Adlercreutzia sp. R25]
MASRNKRERAIVKASFVGIAGNMLLVVFKLIVGFMSNSIAIILDAVNNATDALSSIVTIVGTKLADMRPNRRHPFGYGRIEYLTSVIIAIIILVAGALSLRESIDKIAHPAVTNYTALTITVIVVAIVAKVLIGIYFKRAGDKTNSKALIASGIDSNYDAVLSAGTLVVAIAQLAWGVNIDGIVGLIISLVVVKAGLEVLTDALGPIIGAREDDQFGQEILDYVNSYPDVRGTYDLLLDNFGPNEIIGSVHIEVPDNMTARQIHELTRKISKGLSEKFNVLATVGIYADNTTGEFAPMRAYLQHLVKGEPKILQTHGFYVDAETKEAFFDLVIDFKADAETIRNKIVDAMKEKYPDFDYSVIVDVDYEG